MRNLYNFDQKAPFSLWAYFYRIWPGYGATGSSAPTTHTDPERDDCQKQSHLIPLYSDHSIQIVPRTASFCHRSQRFLTQPIFWRDDSDSNVYSSIFDSNKKSPNQKFGHANVRKNLKTFTLSKSNLLPYCIESISTFCSTLALAGSCSASMSRCISIQWGN